MIGEVYMGISIGSRSGGVVFACFMAGCSMAGSETDVHINSLDRLQRSRKQLHAVHQILQLVA